MIGLDLNQLVLQSLPNSVPPIPPAQPAIVAAAAVTVSSSFFGRFVQTCACYPKATGVALAALGALVCYGVWSSWGSSKKRENNNRKPDVVPLRATKPRRHSEENPSLLGLEKSEHFVILSFDKQSDGSPPTTPARVTPIQADGGPLTVLHLEDGLFLTPPQSSRDPNPPYPLFPEPDSSPVKSLKSEFEHIVSTIEKAQRAVISIRQKAHFSPDKEGTVVSSIKRSSSTPDLFDLRVSGKVHLGGISASLQDRINLHSELAAKLSPQRPPLPLSPPSPVPSLNVAPTPSQPLPNPLPSTPLRDMSNVQAAPTKTPKRTMRISGSDLMAALMAMPSSTTKTGVPLALHVTDDTLTVKARQKPTHQ